MNNKQKDLDLMLSGSKELAQIISKEIINDTPYGMYDEETLINSTYIFLHVLSNISVEKNILTEKSIHGLFKDVEVLINRYTQGVDEINIFNN